jgi:hypothetical protein
MSRPSWASTRRASAPPLPQRTRAARTARAGELQADRAPPFKLLQARAPRCSCGCGCGSAACGFARTATISGRTGWRIGRCMRRRGCMQRMLLGRWQVEAEDACSIAADAAWAVAGWGGGSTQAKACRQPSTEVPNSEHLRFPGHRVTFGGARAASLAWPSGSQWPVGPNGQWVPMASGSQWPEGGVVGWPVRAAPGVVRNDWTP